MFIAARYVQAPRSSGVQCGIDGGTQEAMLLAPEGRHVYSSEIRPSPALQRSAMWYRWWNTGSYAFSPRGATCSIANGINKHTKAPEGRHVAA